MRKLIPALLLACFLIVGVMGATARVTSNVEGIAGLNRVSWESPNVTLYSYQGIPMVASAKFTVPVKLRAVISMYDRDLGPADFMAFAVRWGDDTVVLFRVTVDEPWARIQHDLQEAQ